MCINALTVCVQQNNCLCYISDGRICKWQICHTKNLCKKTLHMTSSPQKRTFFSLAAVLITSKHFFLVSCRSPSWLAPDWLWPLNGPFANISLMLQIYLYQINLQHKSATSISDKSATLSICLKTLFYRSYNEENTVSNLLVQAVVRTDRVKQCFHSKLLTGLWVNYIPHH